MQAQIEDWSINDGQTPAISSQGPDDDLQFKMEYSVAKYKQVYDANLGTFVSNGKIDLRKVQSQSQDFYACIDKCFPRVNVLKELKMLASKAKPAQSGDGYVVKVSKDDLEHMLLFHFVAKAAEAQSSCVPTSIICHLSLKEETCIDGFKPDNVSLPGAQSEDPARVLFVPSYARWDKTKMLRRWQEMSLEIHVVFVVRSYEFAAYHTGLEKRTCSILCLPDDTQWGIGYARYIIVELMKKWGLKYGIMCDDSMCHVYELAGGKYKTVSGEMDCKKFKKMLTDICRWYSKEEFRQDVACISPAIFNGCMCPAKMWTWEAPTMCQVLNVELITEKGINFRPELRVNMEDLIFGLDCYKAGLKCLTWHQYALHEGSFKGGNTQNAEIGSPPRSDKRRSTP